MKPITPILRKIRTIFGLKLAVHFSAIVVAMVSIARIREEGTLLGHTQEVRSLINRMHADLRGMDASVRGYVITRHAKYLGRMESGWTEVERDVAALTAMTEDNPRQQDNLRLMYDLVAAGRIAAVEIVRTPDKAGGVMARTVETAERVEMLVWRMNAEEERLLRVRQANMERQVSRAYYILPLLVLVAVALAVVTQVIITYHTDDDDVVRDRP